MWVGFGECLYVIHLGSRVLENSIWSGAWKNVGGLQRGQSSQREVAPCA